MKAIPSLLGRIMIAAIFLLSAVGNKIPKFNDVATYMAGEGVPYPKILLAGAIVFLIAGALSIILGYKARIGALLLLVFLIAATYYFHDFWTYEGEQRQQQTIQFMKNVSLIGTMVFIIANGGGALALDNWTSSSKSTRTGDF